jgi:hypothetical protein
MLILAHSVGAWSLREAHSDINAQAFICRKSRLLAPPEFYAARGRESLRIA